jgi:hypothetical protein
LAAVKVIRRWPYLNPIGESEMDHLRKILAESIADHKAAAERSAAAASTADGASAFVKATQARVDSFATIDARVSGERATAVKAALAADKQPSFALSADLAEALADRVEAQNQLDAARQAAAALASDANEASVDERRRLGEVQAIVNAIVTEEIDDVALREAAFARLRSERMRGVTVKEQITLDGALAAEEQTALKSADHIEARVVSRRARRAGSVAKVDGLQGFINSIVEKRPKITVPELLDKIRAEVGSGGPIVDLDKTSIWFVGAHDQSRSATISGLKDRLSRAKRKMKSKD